MSTQVKKKAAEADEWIRQNAAAAQGEAADDSSTPDNTDEGEAPSAIAEVTELEPVAQSVPDDIPSTPEADIAQQIADLKAEAQKADQRWRSLQGQIGSKDKQIEQLHDLLGKLQEAPAAPEPAVPAVPMGHTAADVEAFGEDMVDVIERIARKIAAENAGNLQHTLDDLKQEVTAVSQYTAAAVVESFDTKLDKLAPNWRQLDTDDGFNAWLDASKQRRPLFNSMASVKDAEGTAEFFNMYNTVTGVSTAAAESKQRKKADQLEKQVVPGKSRSTKTSAQSTPEEGIIPKSEIQMFYANKKQYTTEEFAAGEKKYAKAMKDDRVDYTK